MNKHIKGVLFDFDGTLTAPGTLNFSKIKREIGCPADIPVLEYIETLPITRRVELNNILESREREAALISLPNINAEKVIGSLKKRGVRLGILTRNSLASVSIALQSFNSVNIEDFNAVISRGCSAPKPHPDGVYKAALLMEVDVTELLVVGDFRFDIIAGKSSGTRTALLTNGNNPISRENDPCPDYTIENLDMILDILQKC